MLFSSKQPAIDGWNNGQERVGDAIREKALTGIHGPKERVLDDPLNGPAGRGSTKKQTRGEKMAPWRKRDRYGEFAPVEMVTAP